MARLCKVWQAMVRMGRARTPHEIAKVRSGMRSRGTARRGPASSGRASDGKLIHGLPGLGKVGFGLAGTRFAWTWWGKAPHGEVWVWPGWVRACPGWVRLGAAGYGLARAWLATSRQAVPWLGRVGTPHEIDARLALLRRGGARHGQPWLGWIRQGTVRFAEGVPRCGLASEGQVGYDGASHGTT